MTAKFRELRIRFKMIVNIIRGRPVVYRVAISAERGIHGIGGRSLWNAIINEVEIDLKGMMVGISIEERPKGDL
ncbi:hypothetical protein AB0H71_28955 [Nocardia sp. NPDC050697]|uniref:hypothetical protein n=1 Tax=Nocardia sp. NPDC050697 TaxID=3155158 RepID=UPI0033BFE143